MSASLCLRLLRRRPSLPLNLTTPFTASIFRLLSTTETPLPNPQFVVRYLIQSCGLSSNEAIRASTKIQHLKSLNNADSVLQFLREIGISESSIRKGVLKEPRLLCCNVEKTLRPNVAKLQELILSKEDISGMISNFPGVFRYKIVPKVDFLMRVLGSVENLAYVLTKQPLLLQGNLDKVLIPNLFFLQEQCGLPICRIIKLITLVPWVIVSRPGTLEINAKRAEELGFARGNPMFIYALSVVNSLSQSTIDAKQLYLKSCGLSREEVTLLISKAPLLLMTSEEVIGRKMEFLLKEAGCNKLDVVRNPSLLMYSLDKRLIPRNVVRNLLKSKGLPAANQAFATFTKPNEKQFVQRFVLPYEPVIPWLHRAYMDACTERVEAIE